MIVPFSVRRKQQFPHRYYTTSAPDAQIESFNAALRDELGLGPGDVSGIDLRE